MSPSEETYFGTSVVEHVKSRLPWLLFLMLSATVTQMIMNSYESALVVMPQLAGFIPMLTGTGGNCGSQSSTLVIRGLSVGEIEFRDLFKVIFKEVRVAAVVSVILAVVNGIRIIVMGQGDALIALSIGGTMICTVLIAKSRRLYPSDACFQDWTRSCNHGYSAYFYPCRYQYSNRILHDRQPSISFVKTFCI